MAKKPASLVDKHHDCIALVLQGGGALGAYQAGVYEELSKTPFKPKWIAGVSIGAINAALIAGNLPEHRVEKMCEFLYRVSSHLQPTMKAHPLLPDALGNLFPFVQPRSAFNQFSALWSATLGIPGFYEPRMPPAFLHPNGDPNALFLYDTTPLRRTLESLVDFDLINSKRVRLSVGAVNVRTGNSEYFDNHQRRIGPERVMASGALPPAFGPVEIDGESYWDGGIVSNTPLQYVLDAREGQSILALQVDLFSARGAMPVNLAEVAQRQKDILYSSRTRYGSNMVAQVANQRQAVRDLLDSLPESLKKDPKVQELTQAMRTPTADIEHLIYRQKPYELESKDYEFSRSSEAEHWESGARDMQDP